MKIDEYAPDATPISSANAKSVSSVDPGVPPNSSSATIGISVHAVVAIDRVSTSDMDRLTIWEKAARGIRGMFSRTRSNTMIVSYIE